MKKKLRQEMKQKLANINKPQYEDYSYCIAQKLYQDKSWKEAGTIGVTISNPPEVDTYQIIRKAWEQGKIVVVPKCDPATKQLYFRQIERFSQLESVFFGLFEPIVTVTREVKSVGIDLLIVPGLAFTVEGYRLGFGGGYYDRILKNFSGEKVSLAFDQQMVPSLPIEEHDQPVKKIITDIEVIVVDE